MIRASPWLRTLAQSALFTHTFTTQHQSATLPKPPPFYGGEDSSHARARPAVFKSSLAHGDEEGEVGHYRPVRGVSYDYTVWLNSVVLRTHQTWRRLHKSLQDDATPFSVLEEQVISPADACKSSGGRCALVGPLQPCVYVPHG